MFSRTSGQSSSPISAGGLANAYRATAQQMGTAIELERLKLQLDNLLKSQAETLARLERVKQSQVRQQCSQATQTSPATTATPTPVPTPRPSLDFGRDFTYCASCMCKK